MRKEFFGSWFSGPIALDPGEAEDPECKQVVEQSHLFHGGQEAKRDRQKRQGKDTPFKGTPSVTFNQSL
jgi:hypothetical protein